MKQLTLRSRFAVCINNGGYIYDLKEKQIYEILPDESAERSHYLRVIDDTGEDYLYPAGYFQIIS